MRVLARRGNIFLNLGHIFWKNSMSINSSSINVAIVEDSTKIRMGLEFLIGSSPNFTCVGAFSSAEEALEMLPRLGADVILMDIALPGISGIECMKRLAEQGTTAQIMMMTVFEDHENIYQSILAGATGYVIKSIPPAELLAAIVELHGGGSPMSSQIARKVLKAFQEIARAQTAQTQNIAQSAITVSAHEAHEYSLGKREQEIIEFLAQGMSYQEIADTIFLSHATIRTHIRNIYRKVQVQSRSEMLSKFAK
ncbi:MAG: DNA-binding response regulator [Candidatus Kapaibacterium sp.]|nr:MAG: DNA-binding response regulator [Candidatus Kapabacteria bacterium]